MTRQKRPLGDQKIHKLVPPIVQRTPPLQNCYQLCELGTGIKLTGAEIERRQIFKRPEGHPQMRPVCSLPEEGQPTRCRRDRPTLTRLVGKGCSSPCNQPRKGKEKGHKNGAPDTNNKFFGVEFLGLSRTWCITTVFIRFRFFTCYSM